MKAKRTTIPQSVRFEVFKRDKFTCQYCGRQAPDVVLECDHIEPVAKGGGNEIVNLLTACKDCNGGKRDRRLSEHEALKKVRQQLGDLEERRQQLEMMAQWKLELIRFSSREVELIAEYWKGLTGFSLDRGAQAGLERLLKKLSFGEICEASDAVVERYCKRGITRETAQRAFDHLPIAAYTARRYKDNPEIPQLLYCKGILRNRFRDMNPDLMFEAIKAAYASGMTVEEIRQVCCKVERWEIIAEIFSGPR